MQLAWLTPITPFCNPCPEGRQWISVGEPRQRFSQALGSTVTSRIPTGDWPSSIIVIHEHRRHGVETQGANREENTSLPGAIRLQPGHHEPVRTFSSLFAILLLLWGTLLDAARRDVG